MIETIVALLMIVNSEIKEHRIQVDLKTCLKGKRVAERQYSEGVRYQCIKSKAELDKAEISLDQYKNQSQLEFNKVKRQLKDAENKLTLTNLALEQSKEALRIRTNRFKQGLEKTSDLLIAETQYLQKQLEYLQTAFNYNFTKAYVEFLTK